MEEITGCIFGRGGVEICSLHTFKRQKSSLFSLSPTALPPPFLLFLLLLKMSP